MKLRNYPFDEQALVRMTRRAGRILHKGTMIAAMGASLGCDPGGPTAEGAAPAPIAGSIAGKADWAQYEGRRNTDLVSYSGNFWHEYSNCNNRGGCMNVGVFVKVRVQPVQGAQLDKKRVGLVYRGDDGKEITATGHYYGKHDDGSEEWHVPLYRNSWATSYFTFNAWYQDGAGDTWFDDNEGELHAIAYQGDYAVIRQDWERTDLTISDAGVKGHISIVLADLDYDKDVVVVWTTDGWKTTNFMEMADADQANAPRWIEDVWASTERWGVDVDLQGEGVETFEYAIRYRHGVVGDAQPYDFWDNNGGRNHVVKRAE